MSGIEDLTPRDVADNTRALRRAGECARKEIGPIRNVARMGMMGMMGMMRQATS